MDGTKAPRIARDRGAHGGKGGFRLGDVDDSLT